MSYHNSRGGPSRGRGGFRGRSGPQLPTALLAEVDPGASNRNRGRPRGAAPRPSRGPQREDVRASLKEFNSARRPTSTPSDRPPKAKRPQVEQVAEPPKKKKKTELTLPGKTAVDAEDGEIEWLEYMLRKEKAKDVEGLDDGLDELLGFADLVGPGGAGLGLEAEESDEEDLSDSGSDEGDLSESEDEDGDLSDLESDEDAESGEEPQENPPVELGPTFEPPIITASTGDSEPRYIPPHMRAAALEAKSRGDKAKELERVKLERKAQGLLNKLSEANMETILAEIEGLYRDHSRNDVSSILTELIIHTIANRSNLLDSFVILYATLVGALHRILGMEFGAHFVHAVIMKYRSTDTTDLPATIYQTPDASKSPLNLLTLIAELYNAQVVSANLIYDLIRSFLTESAPDSVMSEGQVESLLRLLKCSGQQLRSDDPASLKDIVNLVQDKTKGKEKTMTTRARYMVETLVDLKGGKSKQSVEQDATARMRKFITGLGRKRRVATTEPLRVSLQDFVDADTRGRWWLVGAGWAGNPLVEKVKVSKKPAVEDEEVLLEVARGQGMNTDVRRSVFVILMTSEDYIHACDRLSLLKFTEIQQREFVRVALHCCATEKTYNPYHSLIINHLCAESYSHRFTLQYALWDFLRDLDDKAKARNVAQTAAYIVARGSLDLTVFKAVDFTSLKPPGIYFFSIFLSRLLVATQTTSPLFALPKSFKSIDEEAIEETFEKSLVNLSLAQGLVWVLRRKGALEQGSKSLGERESSILRKAANLAIGVLSRAV